MGCSSFVGFEIFLALACLAGFAFMLICPYCAMSRPKFCGGCGSLQNVAHLSIAVMGHKLRRFLSNPIVETS